MSKHDGFFFFFFGEPTSKSSPCPNFEVKAFEDRNDTQSRGLIPDPSNMVPVGGRDLRLLPNKQIRVTPNQGGVSWEEEPVRTAGPATHPPPA